MCAAAYEAAQRSASRVHHCGSGTASTKACWAAEGTRANAPPAQREASTREVPAHCALSHRALTGESDQHTAQGAVHCFLRRGGTILYHLGGPGGRCGDLAQQLGDGVPRQQGGQLVGERQQLGDPAAGQFRDPRGGLRGDLGRRGADALR
ncbi:hypothetical protein GCM10020000_13740 [Streptomyces olivoverticillatus]